MNDLQKNIRNRIHAAQRILITSHIRPDGDAIGSSLALGLALLNAGKKVQIVLSDGVPANFKHLPGAEMVCTRGEGDFDLIVSVDCSDMQRVGQALNGYHAPDLVIDHHVTTDPFGTLNLVEPEAVATASVLTRHMAEWGLEITAPIAANLITGLITDTMGFRTANTTPEALRQAANLLDMGVDMGSLYYRSLVRRTYAEAKYWAAGLSSLERRDGMLWVTLTAGDRLASGYQGKDDADLVNMISSIDDANVAIIFVEQDAGKTKVSWRSLKAGIDVSQLACQFGGGGHRAAAGAEVNGNLAEVKERVLRATQENLKGLRS